MFHRRRRMGWMSRSEVACGLTEKDTGGCSLGLDSSTGDSRCSIPMLP